MSDLTITTLTGKNITLSNCAETDTIKSLKERLQDSEGIPPDQQTWHFPVPAGTEDASSAMKLKGWFSFESSLGPALKAKMTPHALLEPLDKKTFGEVTALQAASESGIAPSAFLVLQMRPLPAQQVVNVRVEAEKWKVWMVDSNPSTMSCAQFHAALRKLHIFDEAMAEDHVIRPELTRGLSLHLHQ